MHFYTRTATALIIAGALLSQTPAIMHADEGSSSSSHSSCYMSRNVNGNRWSSSDCGEARQQMSKDLASISSFMDRLSQPAPKAVAPSVESDPIAEHVLGSIQAFIQHLLFRLPWF